jgi:predicted SnoaL-like aldol condensation-catalyzing enzyme
MVYLDQNAIQELINAFNRRDLAPGSKLFTEDVVLHCPGRSQISGDYTGKLGVIEFWNKQIEITTGSFKAEVDSVFQGEGNLVLIMKVSAEVNDQEYFWRRVNHYRIVEGRVVEGWIYESDQYTVDLIFA